MKDLKSKLGCLHSINELNLEGHSPDSHLGKTHRSTFVRNFRRNFIFTPEMLGTGTAHYPRLLTLSDGSYILFYNTGRTMPDIAYITSKDLVSWSKPKILFQSDDVSVYATCDGVLLRNGELLCCAAKRPRSWKGYTQDMNASFLVTKRSSDNGLTWSEERKVYTGMVWEPSLLQLKSGEVQIYFTHTAPYTALYGYDVSIRSSGSAMIRSYDNGYSWTPDIRSDNVDPLDPYAAIRIMQQKIGEKEVISPENGEKVIKPWFNDQMPVAIQLNNGSIAVTAESLLHFYEHPVNGGKYQVSIAFSHDNWSVPVGREEEGPSDRINNFDRAAGPYISQMPSGEVLISHTNQYSKFEYKIADPTAHRFSRDYDFDIGVKNLWSMTEQLSGHCIACVADDGNNTKGAENGTLSLGYAEMILNHDIDVKRVERDRSWSTNTEALFIGSLSQAQMSLRFSHDEENLLVLSEVLDSNLTENDGVTVKIRNHSGVYSLYADILGATSSDVDVRTAVYDDGSDRAGYAIEFSVSKNKLGITKENNTFYVTAELRNSDPGKEMVTDTIPYADIESDTPFNCPVVTLSD